MRIRIVTLTLLTILLDGNLAGALQAGQSLPAGFRGPVLGYVLDPKVGAVRPINGILGSSSLGKPVALPVPVAAAAFSPQADFALVISASDDEAAYVLRNPGGTNNIEPIDGAINGADRVVFNADGSAGAFLSSAARQLQIVRDLPASPALGPAVDLSSIPGTITALAIDQSGSNILIAAAAERGGLYLVTGQQQLPRLIAAFVSPTALALSDGGRDVVVADAALNEITLIRKFADSPEIFHIAGERDGVSGPAGLRISADSRKLYIANGRGRTLEVWDFETQSIEASYTLDAEPTRLTALQGSSTFVLNDVGDHELLLLDAINMAAYFVPAGRDRND